MKLTKNYMIALAAIAVLALLMIGYRVSNQGSGTPQSVEAASISLCMDCGQVKGAELCCQPDQTKCASCGLVKGSPGCCKIPKGAESVSLCNECGHIKSSELCCMPYQTICDKCGLVKGTAGCCKISTK
ncbi:MAG: hypothetical protein ACYSSP_03870 [Planctomycetota bacterium]|jgi:hypothetical protein